MKRFAHREIGVDQGEVPLFSDYEDEGEMWSGKGARMRLQAVLFSEPFRAPPAVHVSMSMWDIHNGSNARADITAENVTEDGFDLVFRTWGDTRIARARARWMAIGPVSHEDDWDLY